MQDRIEELQAGLQRVADEKQQLEAQTSHLATQLKVIQKPGDTSATVSNNYIIKIIRSANICRLRYIYN
jgi:hypothetical protein